MTVAQPSLTPEQVADQTEVLTLKFADLIDGVPVPIVLEAATWLIRATAESNGEEQQAIVILVDAAVRLHTKLGGGAVAGAVPSIPRIPRIH